MRTFVSMAVLCGLLGACAPTEPVRRAANVSTPPAWQAPVPAPVKATGITRSAWWLRFEDPLLVQLIDAAQAASPDLAGGLARIEGARANRVAAGAALLPQVNAAAGAQREKADKPTPIASTRSAGFISSWELDLFGAGRATRDAQQALLEGAEVAMQGARIAVAAETASSYTGYRACEAQLREAELDARSRAETARVTEVSRRAGLLASGDAATVRAAAAQSRALVVANRARCDKLVKGLVVLTAWDESRLRQALESGAAKLPKPPGLSLQEVPAALLKQRPDLVQASLNVSAAAAQSRAADAREWPTVSFTGSLGALRASTAAGSFEGRTWSVGPLQVTLPVFDGGVRKANRRSAEAAYNEAVVVLQARVRQAVREVEESLVELESTQAREADARMAAQDFELALGAADTRFRSGLSSVFELEEARRNSANSRLALVALELDRALAWIALYRALGGGWDGQLAAR